MPIDPSMLAKSIGTLTDLHPDQDLPATLAVGLGPTRTGIVPVARPIGPRPGSPDAQALILSGCGHLPHVEDPAAFSRAMVAFLDQADRRTSPARTSG